MVVTFNMPVLPFLAWISSGHSFPPLIAGLVTILYLNEVPVASDADQSDQSDTIHGSGAGKKYFNVNETA